MQWWPGCLQAKSLEGKLVETEKRLRDVVQASQMQAAKARLEVSSTPHHLGADGCNRQTHASTCSAGSCSEFPSCCMDARGAAGLPAATHDQCSAVQP